MGAENLGVSIGEIEHDGTTGGHVEVLAMVDSDGDLLLWRKSVKWKQGDDIPCTVVKRKALLNLSQGPFSKGQVEDHL